MSGAKKKEAVTKAAGGDAVSYRVISPLSHDGVLYEIDESIELTEQQAAPLLGHTLQVVAPQELVKPAETAQ